MVVPNMKFHLYILVFQALNLLVFQESIPWLNSSFLLLLIQFFLLLGSFELGLLLYEQLPRLHVFLEGRDLPYQSTHLEPKELVHQSILLT